MVDFDEDLTAFAAEVGPDGPVCVRGGGTRWSLGGEAEAGTREVQAPAGIVAFEPAEMTVRVRAGTPVTELHEELASAGQRTALPERSGGTVGGALMAGESSIARRWLGPVRDALLQARYVCADGQIASAGAATVKNVSGFDLCRLLVGSLGTLGLVGEALLRTVPVGETERWVRLAGADPGEARSCHTTASVLWDGTDVWTLLSGYDVDVDEDLGRLAVLSVCDDVDGRLSFRRTAGRARLRRRPPSIPVTAPPAVRRRDRCRRGSRLRTPATPAGRAGRGRVEPPFQGAVRPDRPPQPRPRPPEEALMGAPAVSRCGICTSTTHFSPEIV